MSRASILSNVMSQTLQDEVENNLLSVNFPWYSLRDIKSPVLLEKRNGFQHTFLDEAIGINSPWFYLIEEIAKEFNLPTLVRSKAFLQIPLNNLKSNIDRPHVDHNAEHITNLYFVKDSDGDTLIYENNKLIQSFTPKKGSIVTFPSDTLHTPIQPISNTRCVINIITLKENL